MIIEKTLHSERERERGREGERGERERGERERERAWLTIMPHSRKLAQV